MVPAARRGEGTARLRMASEEAAATVVSLGVSNELPSLDLGT